MAALNRPAVWLGLIALGGCASKGDLRRVEEQLVLSRGENMRADSARAVQLAQVFENQRRIMDSLAVHTRMASEFATQLSTVKGDIAGDLYNIQQQLVQIQALTGQSQMRLTELRTQLEARGEQLSTGPYANPDTGMPGPAPTGGPQPSADQIYEASLQQLRRGSPITARAGFREMLRLYPTDAKAPDATYFIGESYAAENPDSAAVYYRRVVDGAPKSVRAASAVYKLGLLAERRKDLEGARGFYQQVIADYPRSDEAALARDRLKSLGR